MKKQSNQKKAFFKNVYFLALVPFLSIWAYLAMLAGGLVEEIYAGTIVILVVMTLVWGGAGFLFYRSRVTLFHSVWIANFIPIASTLIYFVLYLISVFTESESLINTAEIIGGLGTGIFGVFGILFHALAPFDYGLWEVLISLAMQICVFVVGYSIGGYTKKKMKKIKK